MNCPAPVVTREEKRAPLASRAQALGWRVLRDSPLLALLLCAIAFAGCQTPLSFPTPSANWETHTGQLQYLGAGGRSIIGEFVVRRSGREEFQLDFRSGPGFPLLRLWQSGSQARAEGALARGSWQGAAERAPRALAGWLKLREVFAELPSGQRAPRHPAWTAEVRYTGTRPERLSVSIPENGDRFTFQFSR